MTTTTVRAITAGEYNALRDTHGAQIGLIIGAVNVPPVTVYERSIAFTDDFDNNIQMLISGATVGAFADVKLDMALRIEADAAKNALPYFWTRARLVPDANLIYYPRQSHLRFTANKKARFVDDFRLSYRPRETSTTDAATTAIDSLSYSNQHGTFTPVPVMGPDAVCVSGATVSFDGSSSWCLSAGTITYSWVFTGATATTGTTTATPTATYGGAKGSYRVALTVTCNGVSKTGYRYVHVYKENENRYDYTDFTIDDLAASTQAGGWVCRITLQGVDDLTAYSAQYLGGQKVVLHSENFYSAALNNTITQISDRGNIVFIGRIDGNTVQANPDAKTVSFSVVGPQAVLQKIPIQPFILRNVSSGASWDKIPTMTPDKALWHIAEWASTITTCMDFVRPGISTQCNEYALSGSIWDALIGIAGRSKCFVRCDRYGRLFIQLDPEYMSTADKASITTVFTPATTDIERGSLQLNTNYDNQVGRIEISGQVVSSPGVDATLYALAAGHQFGPSGGPQTEDNLVVASQTAINAMAANMWGAFNNPYTGSFSSPQNNMMIDICPQQYMNITNIATANNPLGTLDGWAGRTSNLAIIKSLAYRNVAGDKGFAWGFDVEFVLDPIPGVGITGDPNNDYKPPENPNFDIVNFTFDTSLNILTPKLPPLVGGNGVVGDAPNTIWLFCTPANAGKVAPYARSGLWITQNFNSAEPTWTHPRQDGPDDWNDWPAFPGWTDIYNTNPLGTLTKNGYYLILNQFSAHICADLNGAKNELYNSPVDYYFSYYPIDAPDAAYVFFQEVIGGNPSTPSTFYVDKFELNTWTDIALYDIASLGASVAYPLGYLFGIGAIGSFTSSSVGDGAAKYPRWSNKYACVFGSFCIPAITAPATYPADYTDGRDVYAWSDFAVDPVIVGSIASASQQDIYEFFSPESSASTRTLAVNRNPIGSYKIFYSDDGFATSTESDTSGVTTFRRVIGNLDMSFGGEKAAGWNYTGTAWNLIISSDGGATFIDSPVQPSGTEPRVIKNLGHPDKWLIISKDGNDLYIEYTDDFFTTIIVKNHFDLSSNPEVPQDANQHSVGYRK